MGTINRQIIVNKFTTPEKGVSVRQQDYKDPKPNELIIRTGYCPCLLYTSPSPRDATLSRMPSSA